MKKGQFQTSYFDTSWFSKYPKVQSRWIEYDHSCHGECFIDEMRFWCKLKLIGQSISEDCILLSTYTFVLCLPSSLSSPISVHSLWQLRSRILALVDAYRGRPVDILTFLEADSESEKEYEYVLCCVSVYMWVHACSVSCMLCSWLFSQMCRHCR